VRSRLSPLGWRREPEFEPVVEERDTSDLTRGLTVL
jgi:hypothetical protein